MNTEGVVPRRDVLGGEPEDVRTAAVLAMEDLLDADGPGGKALSRVVRKHRPDIHVDGRVLRYFLKPYFVAGRLALEPRTIVGRTFLRILDSAVGLAFLRELSEFFLAFEGLFDSFRKTAVAMEALLRHEGTTFILVTTPSSSRVSEGALFAEALRARSLRASAVVANRVHPWAIPGAANVPSLEASPGGSVLPKDVLAELRALASREQTRADTEGRYLRQIATRSGLPAIAIPELETDVHDLRSLGAIATWLLPRTVAP